MRTSSALPFLVCGSIWLAVSGCTLRPVSSGGDGGSGGGSGGGGQGGEGGEGGEAVDEGCSAFAECDACRQCAASDPCMNEYQACLNNPVCVAIDECLSLCGSTPDDCWETCRAQNATGVAEYDVVRGCIDCIECEDACSSPLVCGG